MKVLVLTPLYPPAVGGAASAFADLVPRLLLGDDIDRVTVLTERLPGAPRHLERGDLHIRRELPTRVAANALPRALDVWRYLRTQLWFGRHFGAAVRAGGYDLVHFHTRFRGPAFFRALARLPVPVVADLRDQLTDAARVAACSRLVLCCGRAVWRFARRAGVGEEKLRLVPVMLGADPADAPHPPAAEPAPVLFVGDLSEAKGVPLLLEAFAALDRDDRDPRRELILVGVNRGGRRMVERIEATDGARWLGWQDHGRVLELMTASGLVVLPSRSEGFPQVILEALALGTKVLAPPDIPELDEHIPEWVLDELSAPALARAMTRALARPDRPVYPLSEHRPEAVVGRVVAAYTEALIP